MSVTCPYCGEQAPLTHTREIYGGRITQSELKRVLHYNPDTGVFIRLLAVKGHKAGTVAGAPKNTGYVVIQINRKRYLAHRLAWLYIHGYWPVQIDHVDQDRGHNWINNLREVTNLENSKNRPIRKDSKSGVPGVYKIKDRKDLWSIQINVNGVRKSMGCCKTFEEAVQLRKEAESKYGYHTNHGINGKGYDR